MTVDALEARIASNLDAVRGRIERAAERAGRDPADVRLVAVSKTFGAEHVRAAWAAGQRDFGENRVQELTAKAAATADLPIRWHLVGHLQSNKARKAAGSACIHSVDRTDLIEQLERSARALGTSPALLVQADLAGEPTKHGAPADHVRRLFDAARTAEAVKVRGLMILPPYLEDPEEVRPYFRGLVALRARLLADGVPPPMLQELSMGMSHDFDVAIEEGATMIRVGSAVFGARTPGSAA